MEDAYTLCLTSNSHSAKTFDNLFVEDFEVVCSNLRESSNWKKREFVRKDLNIYLFISGGNGILEADYDSNNRLCSAVLSAVEKETIEKMAKDLGVKGDYKSYIRQGLSNY